LLRSPRDTGLTKPLMGPPNHFLPRRAAFVQRPRE